VFLVIFLRFFFFDFKATLGMDKAVIDPIPHWQSIFF
jgi:hypothetical protein